MRESYTFGNCTAYKRQDTGVQTWCVLRGNAEIGIWFDSSTQACVFAALIDPLSDEQWNAVKRRVLDTMRDGERAAA